MSTFDDAQRILTSGDNVPEVDPSDIRKLWMLYRTLENTSAAVGTSAAIDMGVMKQECGAGADVLAVWYRISILQLMAMTVTSLTRWMHDGTPDDVLIQVAAKFPMEWMTPGLIHSGPPFDTEEFLKQVENAHA